MSDVERLRAASKVMGLAFPLGFWVLHDGELAEAERRINVWPGQHQDRFP